MPDPAPIPTPLVLAAQRGDRAAFARLHDLYRGLIHGILLARLKPADADDAVQEVFLSAWTRMGDLRDPGAFAPWLCAIARHFAAGTYRRTSARSSVSVSDDAAASPSDALAAREQAQAVLAAIKELPDAYREPLILRLVERLSGPQIAAALDMTHGSVRVNLCRGFDMLEARLAATRGAQA